jgi:hypothetical protein
MSPEFGEEMQQTSLEQVPGEIAARREKAVLVSNNLDSIAADHTRLLEIRHFYASVRSSDTELVGRMNQIPGSH